MSIQIDLPFPQIASSLSTKFYDCVFSVNESNGLCFVITSKLEDERKFMELVFGSFLPKLRKELKKWAYTVASAPNIGDGFVGFDLCASPFANALASLCDGFSERDSLIAKSVELLEDDEQGRLNVKEALKLLEAVAVFDGLSSTRKLEELVV